MLLLLDIGNTNIHLGVSQGEELLANWDVSNRRSRKPDELGILLKALLKDRGIDPGNLRGVAVACVVPPLFPVVEETIDRYFGHDPYFVGPESARELLVHFDDPREVGADRIANAVGGFHKYGGPLIVVDFGTATTFDAVSRDGAYLGGAIAPGIQISTEALFHHAARLPRIDLVRPSRAVATNTVESIQSGVIFGYAGLVEALVTRIGAEVGENPRAVATGGLARLIAGETGIIGQIDPHLTLDGLRLLFERQK